MSSLAAPAFVTGSAVVNLEGRADPQGDYLGYMAAVRALPELDGRLFHSSVAERDRDLERDLDHAAEIGAHAVLKATNVDGVYSADPKKDPSAKRFDRLTHSQAIAGDYKVMDATAFALAREATERARPFLDIAGANA